MTAPPSRRTLLGTAADISGRQRVYETADAVVVDHANGFSGTRLRVFYDEVLLVTRHDFIGWPLAVALAGAALLMGMAAGLSAFSGSAVAALVWGLPALFFGVLMVLRLAFKVKTVTVHGRRSRVRVSFWLRTRKAHATFSRLCARVLQAQERTARAPERGPSPLANPGPPEVV